MRVNARGGAVFLWILVGCVPFGSQNTNLLSKQKVQFSIPYFRPDPWLCSQLQTWWLKTAEPLHLLKIEQEQCSTVSGISHESTSKADGVGGKMYLACHAWFVLLRATCFGHGVNCFVARMAQFLVLLNVRNKKRNLNYASGLMQF